MGSNQTSNLSYSSNMGSLPQVSGFTLLRDVGDEIVESSSFVGTASLPRFTPAQGLKRA